MNSVLAKQQLSGLFLDEDGIIRDDTELYNQVTQWTDSGLGGDKRSSTSTLKHFDFPASFEEDPHPLDERSLNISELEASRDFTFDASYASVDDQDFNGLRNSDGFNQTLRFQDTDDLQTTGSDHVDLFNEEYYQQLKDLGVLVDGAELSLQRQSLVEFESLEAELKAAGQPEVEVDPLAQYFTRTEPNDSYLTGQSFQLNSEHFLSQEDLDPGKKTLYEREKSGDEDNLDTSRPASRARSDRTDRTVSSRSFPEVSPEEALDLYNASRQDRIKSPSKDAQDIPLVDNDAESIEFDDSQKDEVKGLFNAAEIARPSTPSKIPLLSNRTVCMSPPVVRNRQKEKLSSYASDHCASPVNKERSSKKGKKQQREQRAITPTSVKSDRQRSNRRPGSDSPSERRPRRRHDSSGSQLSVASDIVSQSPVNSQKHRPNSQKSLGKARSQESFFDQSGSEKGEKQPKRILPKPNMTADQNFKLKSKSTTNISSKPGPVKPTHMSLAEITSLTIDDSEDVQSEAQSVTSERSKGELKAKLNQESSQRKQATELVHQLQKDYDSLLSKYALAELTIDQLRLGAKITLYSDSPTPSQAYSGTLVSAQQPLVTNMLASSRGLMTSSPAPGKSGHFSPLPGQDGLDIKDVKFQTSGIQTSNLRSSLPVDKQEVGSASKANDGPPSLLASSGVEQITATLAIQTRSLDERAESFKALLEENHLSVEQQEKVFEKLRADHDKLRRDYLQAKEDYDVLRRTQGADGDFDESKELEGELFRLGMKFDDIHEKVESNVKLKSSQRLPFQNSRSRAATPDSLGNRSIDQLKPQFSDPNAGYNLVKPIPNRVFDDKLQRLHEDYNNLMQLYRRVKQRGQSANREQEIDNLVQKLWDICEEAPDVFKLPEELQDRLDEMNQSKSDPQLSPLMSPSPGSRQLSDSSESLNQSFKGRESPGSLRLSQLEATPKRGISSTDRRRLEDIRVGRFSPKIQERGANSANIRPLSGRASPMNPRQGQRGGRGENFSPLDRNSPMSNSRDFNGDGLKKNYQGGSQTSLPDSGISEQSQGNGTLGSTRQKLPPRKREFDTDSGIVGSVASVGTARPQNVLLRHRGSLDEDRLQEVEEGAVGGRDSPGIGAFPVSDRSKQNRTQADQTSVTGDLTESDISDFDLQGRRAPQDRRSQDESWDQSSLDDDRYDPHGTQTGQQARQLSSEKKTVNNPSSRQQSKTELQTPKKKTKPQVYYSEDSESEEEEEFKLLPQGSRSLAGQQSRSGSVSSDRPRSQQGYYVKQRRESGSESSERPRSQQGRYPKQRTESGSVSSDRSRLHEKPRPVSANEMSRTAERLGSGSRRGSRDSHSDSLERSQGRANHFQRSRPRSGSGDKVTGRKYATDKRLRDGSTGSQQEHNSTFSVDDESEGSIQSARGHQRSRSKESSTNSFKTDSVKGHGSESSPKVYSNSSRLKALQKEIERLKDDVKKVNDGDKPEASNVSQKPQLRYNPDNPFGFMEGQETTYPRRRANSFSGSPARQYDDWLMFQPSLPQQCFDQQQHQQQSVSRRNGDDLDGVQQNSRRSRNATKQYRRPFSANLAESSERNFVQSHDGDDDDEDYVQNHPLGIYRRYGNRTRRYSEDPSDRQRWASRAYRSARNGGRAYPLSSEESSQPYSDAVAMDTTAPPQYLIPSGYVYYSSGVEPENVQYVAQPMLSSSPIRGRSPSRVGPMVVEQGFSNTGMDPQVPMYTMQPAVCPHCGRTSYHTHGAFVFPAQQDEEMVTSGADVLQLRRGRRRSKSHQRSRSLSRQRYYSPDRSPHRQRYFVREFSRNQSDTESEDERPRPRYRARSRSVSRSRSLSRSKGHQSRRYRRSRSGSVVRPEDTDSDSTLSGGSGPRLDDSLHLASRTARDIDNLTRKMMSAVEGEIIRHSRSRERRYRKPVW
ncbi:serine/arginine repetitive matrix protein 2-like isoform X2 [Liolophura sinensis]|uniref:serine/arginine repetitive matrix protein 2-like isoform X2 n=1 Tax=Liolophura sinensis TaxID=3198878 RepID=UPI0031593A15